jgi:hypothetical protein
MHAQFDGDVLPYELIDLSGGAGAQRCGLHLSAPLLFAKSDLWSPCVGVGRVHSFTIPDLFRIF